MTQASIDSIEEAQRAAKLAAIYIEAAQLTSQQNHPANIATFEAMLLKEFHRFRGQGFFWWQHILSPMASIQLHNRWKVIGSAERLSLADFNYLRSAIAKLRYGQSLDLESHKLLDALRSTNILSDYLLRRFACGNGSYGKNGRLFAAKISPASARSGTIFGSLLLFASLFFVICFFAAAAQFGFQNNAMLLVFWQWFANFLILGYTLVKVSGVRYRLDQFTETVLSWYFGIDRIEVATLSAQAPKKLLHF